MSASSATLLGGGLSWLARKHGIGANHVTAAELVTADGTLRRVDREHEPDLFWAIRGGGGDFGIVTALEFDLFPLTEVYAGVLWFPVERAGEVLRAWRDWTNGVPEEMTSVGRIMQFPPLPFFPDEIRGKSFALVEAIWCGDEFDGRRLARAAARARAGPRHGSDDSGAAALPPAHGSRAAGRRRRATAAC